MSSELHGLLALAGVFSIALGVVHLWIPRIFAIDRAIGLDEAGDTMLGAVGLSTGGLGVIGLGPWRYARRRADAVGLTWVMSNAASCVLVTVGVIDLAWAAGHRPVPVPIGAVWIAGWWLLRAGGQFAIGRRRADLGIAAGFAGLAVIHILVAVT